MCGILAQFNATSAVNQKLFDHALKLLTHRGPDESDHTLLRNNSLCFGHTRLSIVGIDNGRQPLANPDKTIYAIVNGEFYDYKQIKYDLSLEGYRFITHTDSEIILALYHKYGYDCFRYLNGEFAGIIFDTVNDRLVIFRDRNGVKPLFYKRTRSGIVLSSEIKAILDLEQQKPQWNIDYLKQLFCATHTQDETIFNDIFNVKPAHYMVYDLKSGSLSEKRYWSIDYNRSNYFDMPLADLSKAYEKQLLDAVARRLVADVPVATYLSGGIDSSSCYGLASTLAGSGVDAFTIAFDSPDYNEFSLAQKLVKKYGGRHHILEVGEKILFDNFERHLWYMESPVFNPHTVAKYLLSRLVREAGFKVVITGEGSDEYNAGYAPSVIDAAKFEHHQSAHLSAEILSVSAGAMLNAGAHELQSLKGIFGFSQSWLENSAAANVFMNGLYAGDFKTADADADIAVWAKPRYISAMQNWDVLNTSLYLTGQMAFAYVLTVLGDRTEMAHSVEARLPFLDHKVTEFLAKVPPKFKATPDADKFLLREAVRKYVTPEHYAMHKHPYVAPPLLSPSSLFAGYMQDIFSSQWFADIGLFDAPKVLDLLKTTITANEPQPEMEKHLFKVLSFAVVHQTFGFANL